MNKKREKERGEKPTNAVATTDAAGKISSKTDLKSFLLSLRDRMTDESAPPVYAMAAMNHVLTLPDIYNLLDNETKEIARDIWLRLKQAGFQVKSPPLLFTAEDDGVLQQNR